MSPRREASRRGAVVGPHAAKSRPTDRDRLQPTPTDPHCDRPRCAWLRADRSAAALPGRGARPAWARGQRSPRRLGGADTRFRSTRLAGNGAGWAAPLSLTHVFQEEVKAGGAVVGARPAHGRREGRGVLARQVARGVAVPVLHLRDGHTVSWGAVGSGAAASIKVKGAAAGAIVPPARPLGSC